MNARLWIIASTILVMLLVSCSTAAPFETPVPIRSAEDVQRIIPAEARSLLDRGQAILYDTRSAESYRTQHVAGAISFPEADVAARINELADDKALIFY